MNYNPGEQPSEPVDQPSSQANSAQPLPSSQPTVYAPESAPSLYTDSALPPPPPPPSLYPDPASHPYNETQQVAYGVNPYESATTPSPASTPRKKSRRWLWISLIVVVVVLAGAATTTIILLMNSPSNAVNSVVQSYYNAVEQQDYTTAYTYVDSNQYMTATGQHVVLSRADYTRTARATDQASGKLTNYTITSTTVTNDTATVSVNVTRGGTTHQVNVQLQQVNGVWEIDQILTA